MTVQMPRISTQALTGPARIQKVRLTATKQVAWEVNMKTWDTKAKDYIAVEPFRVAVEQAPKYLKAGDWNLRVASDKTKILSGIPDSAVLVCEFHDIPHAENSAPAPTVQSSHFDPGKPWIQFSFLYRVVEGDLTDVVIPDYLNYNFGGYEHNGKMVAAYKPATGKSTEALSQRIDALRILEFGYLDWKGEPIQFGGAAIPDMKNILPVIAQRARRAVEELGAKIQVTIVAGKVAQVKPVIGDEEVEWDDGESLPEVTDTASPTTETLSEDDDINWDGE